MFKWYKKIKEFDALQKKSVELFELSNSLKTELEELKKKEPIDLTREALKILPFKKGFEPGDEKFYTISYQRSLSQLKAHTTLFSEIDRILHEQILFIAAQSPNHDATMIARGRIDALAEIKRRIDSADEYTRDKDAEKKGVASEGNQ